MLASVAFVKIWINTAYYSGAPIDLFSEQRATSSHLLQLPEARSHVKLILFLFLPLFICHAGPQKGSILSYCTCFSWGTQPPLPCTGLQSPDLNGTPLLADTFQRHKILLSNTHGWKTADLLLQDWEHKTGHEPFGRISLQNTPPVAAGSFVRVFSTEAGDPSVSHRRND